MDRSRTAKPHLRRRGRVALLLCATVLAAACGSQAATASRAQTSTASTVPATSSTSSANAGASNPSAASAAAAPAGDWLTFDDNASRTGSAPPSGITAANVGRLTLRTVRIDGVADSSAVELSSVLVRGARRDLFFVTTDFGRTIAIDAATGKQLWEFRPRGVNSTPGNQQVTTASPVIDPSRQWIYSADSNGYIHKLSVTTGHQVWARRITFDPVHEKIASALNVSGPYLVAVTGGYYGDIPPYDGHVAMIDRSDGRLAHVWNTECSGRHALIRAASCSVTNTHGDNAIWGRAGAVIEPGSNRILVTTGNGPFDGRSAWGDSVLELTPDASRLLHNWTPRNQAFLDGTDSDLGSTSPALLPAYHGYRLAVQGGKFGVLSLLNLGKLNGTPGAAGSRLGGELQDIPAPGHNLVYTAPAVWRSGSRIMVFVGTDGGTEAYRLVGGARPRLAVAWQNGSGATSPVVSGGLLYTYNDGGQVQIRNPITGAQLRSLPVDSGHWNSPIVVGGRIIEPTGNYHDSAASSTIAIWHLPGR